MLNSLTEAEKARRAALTPEQELLEAARDEVRRSKVTSLPLKCDLGRELGFGHLQGQEFLKATEDWMSGAYHRFRKAVEALTPEP